MSSTGLAGSSDVSWPSARVDATGPPLGASDTAATASALRAGDFVLCARSAAAHSAELISTARAFHGIRSAQAVSRPVQDPVRRYAIDVAR